MKLTVTDRYWNIQPGAILNVIGEGADYVLVRTRGKTVFVPKNIVVPAIGVLKSSKQADGVFDELEEDDYESY